MSEDAKRKISIANKGKRRSPETIEKLKNRKTTAETREKIRLAHLGMKQSPETIEKRVSKFRGRVSKVIGRKHTQEELAKMKGRTPLNIRPVIQLDLHGNPIREWSSITDAAITLNISHISCVLNGKRNNAGGYLWKFKNVA